MRTAVLFYGEIRGTPDHWRDVYEKVVKPNNADVFMNIIYYDKNFLDKYPKEQQEVLIDYYKRKGMTPMPPTELFEIMKPKSICLEEKTTNYSYDVFDEIKDKLNPSFYPINNGDYSYETCKLSFNAILSQNESRKKVTDMKIAYEKRHGFQYDNVIMTRLDIWLTEPIYINVPLKNIYARFWAEDWMLEQIIIGSNELMNTFQTIYPDILEIYREKCSFQYHYMINEHFILEFLKSKGIQPVHFETPICYYHKDAGLFRNEPTS